MYALAPARDYIARQRAQLSRQEALADAAEAVINTLPEDMQDCFSAVSWLDSWCFSWAATIELTTAPFSTQMRVLRAWALAFRIEAQGEPAVFGLLRRLPSGSDDTVEYSGRATVAGYQVTIRFYLSGTSLPPGCVLVERTRTVPEYTTPAHDETYYETVCHEVVP